MGLTHPLPAAGEPIEARSSRSGRAGFGAHLVASGKLAAPALERAERLSAESGERLELVLSRLGLIAERDLAAALAGFLDLPLIGAKDFPESAVLDDSFSRRFLRE